MYNLPTEPRKIKERIRRYERAFAKEQQEFDMTVQESDIYLGRFI